MLAKEIGILMILCHGFLKMPLVEIKGQDKPLKLAQVVASQNPKPAKLILADTVYRKNTVYVKALKYTHERDKSTVAKITLKNTTQQVITDISFLLDGDVAKGCNKAYKVKRKIKLKPNETITISQRLINGDCKAHVVKNLRVRFSINVNFTLD